MYLHDIQLINFKNYKETQVAFSDNVNGVVGMNGTGKTNLLDAIHYLALCKSYFNAQDGYAVNFDADFFAIHGNFISRETQQNYKISCTYKTAGRKAMKMNGKEYDRFSDHIGMFPVVMVSPYDCDIINDGSDVRRKFFDMMIAQFDHEYLHQLISYQKIIHQRNTVLKKMLENRTIDQPLLALYDEQLDTPANYIYLKRKLFIDSILPVFQQHYDRLTDHREEVSLFYQTDMNHATFLQGIQAAYATDMKCGYSTFGVHKDDFLFHIDGRQVKKYGSQGQQKAFALALKLAHFDYIYERKKIKQIILLYDIFDKLDKQRTARLLELVGQDHFGQVFISDTDESRVSNILTAFNIAHQMLNVTPALTQNYLSPEE
ncbi:MAG: DNA replication and repair protein RecF [Bacteroidales bacterium]|jgi:DNA replication and repair protein RecF|nr:DNA replication and repair protein RecF [Bacteroidales bacterium]